MIAVVRPRWTRPAGSEPQRGRPRLDGDGSGGSAATALRLATNFVVGVQNTPPSRLSSKSAGSRAS